MDTAASIAMLAGAESAVVAADASASMTVKLLVTKLMKKLQQCRMILYCSCVVLIGSISLLSSAVSFGLSSCLILRMIGRLAMSSHSFSAAMAAMAEHVLIAVICTVVAVVQ